ncbi:voltage-gated hydrogen channel 1-like protein, partial [Leptotrombidium deliense]
VQLKPPHSEQLFVIALVIVDCLIVVTDYTKVLHFVSLAILSLFMVEIILKIYAFRILFVKSCMEMFDAFVIITSFVLDIVFIGKTDTTAIIGDLIIGLRLWRIIRVIHGIILSVKTPIEHSLEKEKENCTNIQLQLKEITTRASALEKEVQQLRNVLKLHNIDISLTSDLQTDVD